MMIASGFCWTAALMIAICDDAPASVGPEIRFEPPSSFSASSTPECSNSSYGLPSCFGIETVLRPCGISALGSTLLSSLDADVLSFEDDGRLVVLRLAAGGEHERRHEGERGEDRAQGARGGGLHDF